MKELPRARWRFWSFTIAILYNVGHHSQNVLSVRGSAISDNMVINAVGEDAPERIGYFDMTLLRAPKDWKRGAEVPEAIPNGDYDDSCAIDGPIA